MARLAKAGFMINLKKSHLCQETLKVLGHRWHSGGFWYPEPAMLEALSRASREEIRRLPWSDLYGLLNFYQEYILTFPEMTEPLQRLLSYDSNPWTEEAVAGVYATAKAALSGVPWIAFNPAEKARVQTRLTPESISVILLQQNPAKSREWLPVSSWGRLITSAKRQ